MDGEAKRVTGEGGGWKKKCGALSGVIPQEVTLTVDVYVYMCQPWSGDNGRASQRIRRWAARSAHNPVLLPRWWAGEQGEWGRRGIEEGGGGWGWAVEWLEQLLVKDLSQPITSAPFFFPRRDRRGGDPDLPAFHRLQPSLRARVYVGSDIGLCRTVQASTHSRSLYVANDSQCRGGSVVAADGEGLGGLLAARGGDKLCQHVSIFVSVATWTFLSIIMFLSVHGGDNSYSLKTIS